MKEMLIFVNIRLGIFFIPFDLAPQVSQLIRATKYKRGMAHQQFAELLLQIKTSLDRYTGGVQIFHYNPFLQELQGEAMDNTNAVQI